jgi:ribonuclease D
MTEHELIENPEELKELAQKLREEPVIAVDTEADSFFHYFDKVCLLQLGTRSEVFLVDPLALSPEDQLEPIARILANPRIRKIFHAAEYDLYVLRHSKGISVRNIFDTMISAQLLGYPAVGLAALVEHHFKVQLSKDQQRTDWSKRPLRPAQVAYAASDVRYLIELADRLEEELRSKKRLEWAQEEFRALETRVWPDREFDPTGYLRIKGAKGLTPRALAVLRRLFLMRDKRAREFDRPPFKILGNGTLLDLAQRPPNSKRGLVGRRGVSDLVIKRLGADILQAVEKGLSGPDHSPPERKAGRSGRRRLDRRAETRLERLKRWRASRAPELGMDPGVFCPNAMLEEIAWAAPKNREELQGLALVKRWWAKAFGAEVLASLSESPPAPPKGRGERATKAAAPAQGASTRSSRRRARRRRASQRSKTEGG